MSSLDDINHTVRGSCSPFLSTFLALLIVHTMLQTPHTHSHLLCSFVRFFFKSGKKKDTFEA